MPENVNRTTEEWRPGGEDVSHARSERRRDVVGIVFVLAFVFVAHLWIISAGKFHPRDWPAYDSYFYSRLSDAFLHGQLDLLIKPDPRLLALPDPYDPQLNRDLRLHDAILYNGKYYIYWGPVPALVLMPIRWLGRGHTDLPDAYLLFAFTEGLMLSTAALLWQIRRRFFPSQSRAPLLLAMLAAGLAMPIPFLLARAAVYETAIVAGQFFLLAGILFALAAFSSKQAVASAARLALAGGCWALAVGSRASLVIAVGALVALVCLRIWTYARRVQSGVRARAAPLFALAAPLLIGAVLLGVYNHARFGSWHEAGQPYQLAGVPIRKIGPALFSKNNVLPNLFSYAVRPWQPTVEFPSIRADDRLGRLPRWVPVPTYYHTEPITGIVWTTPLLVVLVVPLWQLARGVMSRFRKVSDEVNWLVAVLFCAAILGFAPALLLVGSTMRYFADLAPCLFVLSAIGLWQIERGFAGKKRLADGVIALFAIATTYSCVIAMMLAITGYEFHFQTHNPPLYEWMSRWIGGSP